MCVDVVLFKLLYVEIKWVNLSLNTTAFIPGSQPVPVRRILCSGIKIDLLFSDGLIIRTKIIMVKRFTRTPLCYVLESL